MENKVVLFIVLPIVMLPLIFLTYYINESSNKGIFFGIRIPLAYEKSEEIKALEKYYKNLVTKFFLIPMIISLIIGYFVVDISENIAAIYISIMVFGWIALSEIPYIICYKKMKALKKEKGWTVKTKNIVTVDTSLRNPKKGDKDKPLDKKYYWLLFIFPIMTLISTAIYYKNMPNNFKIPYSTIGIIEKGTVKGVINLLQFPFAQLFLAILFTLIAYKVINSKSDLNSGSIEQAVIRKKKFKKVNSIFMLIAALEMEILFFILQVFTLLGMESKVLPIILLVVVLSTMLIYIFTALKIGQGGRRIETKDEKDDLYKDDDDYWILGGIYYNKKDAALMVEKRVGIGWTINMGNPWAIVISIAFIIFIVTIIGTSIWSS